MVASVQKPPPKPPPKPLPEPKVPHVVVDQPPIVKQPPKQQPPKPHADAWWIAGAAANSTIVATMAMMYAIFAFVCIVI